MKQKDGDEENAEKKGKWYRVAGICEDEMPTRRRAYTKLFTR